LTCRAGLLYCDMKDFWHAYDFYLLRRKPQHESTPMDILLNFLTAVRLAIAPLLLILAIAGFRTAFIVFFIITMVTGLAEEVLARKTHQFTASRSLLFSWGNFLTFFIIISGVWILWPEIIRRDVIFLSILLAAHFIPVILGYLKYSRLTSYDTWTTKLATIMIGCAALYVVTGGPILALEVAIPFYMFARIEEIAITTILPEWEHDVPSLWHALSLERNRSKEATVKTEEKLRAVLAGIDEGYFELDLKGNFTFFNPSLSKYLGYSERELLDMNSRQLMSKETVKKVYKAFKEVYQTGRPSFISDWEVITKSGEVSFYEASVSLLRNTRGEPMGYRCIGRDITERKRAEEAVRIHQEQLYQANKMVALGTLVSGVAHEINNPNNFIRLNAPILKEAWEGMFPILEEYYKDNGDFSLAGVEYTIMRDKIPLLLAGIETGSSHILQIVQDLKNYVQKDSKGFDNVVDLNKVVESALSLISHTIQKSTNRFSVSYGENLPGIKGNFQRLEQVVINLVQNACQALQDKDKEVRLFLIFNKEKECVTLTVEDEGIGILKENLSRITDPFFTTKQDAGGLGLGMSITKRIIEEHHGKILIQSEAGKGTRIEVLFPVQ
jgi:PAS domain S-box-containing protein